MQEGICKKMEIEKLIKLIQTVSESELTGFRYEEKGMKLHLTKKQEKIAAVVKEEAAYIKHEPAAGEEENRKTVKEPSGSLVESSLVGTFYAAPSEEAEPFVRVGDHVKKGQTLAIVEAMKLMNEIDSEYDGMVAEILAENGQPVEYGQPLFRICPE